MKMLGSLAVALVAVVACYPGEVTSTSELDLTLTLRDIDFDFGTVGTFVMRDTIVQINEDDPDAIDISRDYDDDILGTVRANLLALGWSELTAGDVLGGEVPDIAVANLVSATTNTTWWVSGGGWGGCWYYPCYPGWGWGWPPYVGSSSYSVGTYFIVMLDLSGATPGPDVDYAAVWGATMDGMLSSSTASNVTRLIDGIDQAFDQSPYLGN